MEGVQPRNEMEIVAFPGQHARASLKPRLRGDVADRHREAFPAQHPRASLKREARDEIEAGNAPAFPGQHARASLKPVREAVAAAQPAAPSRANTPGPH